MLPLPQGFPWRPLLQQPQVSYRLMATMTWSDRTLLVCFQVFLSVPDQSFCFLLVQVDTLPFPVLDPGRLPVMSNLAVAFASRAPEVLSPSRLIATDLGADHWCSPRPPTSQLTL